MAYTSRSQRVNDAVERGFEKLVLIVLTVALVIWVFSLVGKVSARRLYPHSPSAQVTVRKMWNTLGWCISMWAAVRIVYD